MKISFITLGCKTNQYESEKMAKELSDFGFEVDFGFTVADVFVVNTCSVTAEADKKSRQMVSKCRKLNKDASIIVCGCSSQNNKAQFEGKTGVKQVYGVGNKFELVSFIKQNFIPENSTKSPDFHARRYVKIQDGCNNFCTYCIIPHLRGREKSRPINEIVSEIEHLSNQCSEVVLTGINISAYGRDIGTNLTNLLKALQNVDVRIRLGSLEARIVDEEFLDACKNLKKFCPHFHLSMQSGSNEVLKKMNRHYTKDEFIQMVELIRKYFKNPFIACDLIVGFPTETDENFAETLQTVREINFSFMHIFPYSKRAGTPASQMEQVPANVVSVREKQLLEINNKNFENYLTGLVGSKLEVLVEKNEGGSCEGYSREYVKCYFESDAKVGDIVFVQAEKIKNDGVFAKICQK